jgi:hypothetical protein
MPYIKTAELEELKRGVTPERKPAPDVSIVEEVYKDPRKDRLDRAWKSLAKENGWDTEQLAKAKKEWHVYFSRRDVDQETMADEGYVPFMVPDGKEHKQVKDRGDLLWMIPYDKYLKKAEGPGKLAVQMLNQTMHGKVEKFGRTQFDQNPPE